MSDNLNSVSAPASYSVGRELFFYLLSFITLFLVCLSLGSVIFSAINKWLPDEISSGSHTNLALALSALLVSTPLYWLLNWRLEKELKGGKLPRQSKVRKVLFYLVLVVASTVVLGDVITLLHRFFSGELNYRFGFKVLAILLIGGWAMWYYGQSLYYDSRLQSDVSWSIPKSWFKWHSIALAVVLLAALVLGFIIQGSPVKQQKLKQDQKVLSDVQALYYNLQNYYSIKGELPASLAPVATKGVDDIFYQVVDKTKFKLCANFNYASLEINQAYYQEPARLKGGLEPDWSYRAGQHCFPLEVFKPPAG